MTAIQVPQLNRSKDKGLGETTLSALRSKLDSLGIEWNEAEDPSLTEILWIDQTKVSNQQFEAEAWSFLRESTCLSNIIINQRTLRIPKLADKLSGNEHLETLWILGGQYESADFQGLAQFRKLSSLRLSFEHLADSVLPHLQNCPALKHIRLWGMELTGDRLYHLQTINTLREIEIRSPKLKDIGLYHLAQLKNLEYLHVSCQSVSLTAKNKLQESLPNCEIIIHTRSFKS